MNAPEGLPAVTNALTIDVEDYFQVSAMSPHVDRQSWDSRECRVEQNVQRLLALFADTGTTYAAGDSLRRARFDTGLGTGLFLHAAVFDLTLDVARSVRGGTRVHFSSGLHF